MQQATSHIGNARREERVPLSALIELRTEYGDEALSADVLDVSQSGVGVRAAFVPEVGTRLFCDFRCPPTDDAVHAVGEVVWADWDGPRSGCFGLRFLELDTKSATTIRRYVEPEAAAEPPPPARVANMRIDGVGAPIEADVRLLERDCIVLEQELSFLRLGRGIEVDVPGRGKERGRIASIELRQGPLDTPTLVFGVLLDEKPEPQAQPSSRGPEAASARAEDSADGAPAIEPAPSRTEAPETDVAASVIVSDELLMAGHQVEQVARTSVAPRADTSVRSARPESARKREEPEIVRVSASAAERRAVQEDDADEAALMNRTPPLLAWLKQALLGLWAWTQSTLWPWLRARLEKPPVLEGAAAEASPPLAQRVLLPLARARTALRGAWAKFARGRGPKRRTTAPTPRVQRPQQPVRTQRGEGPSAAPRNRRLLTLGLALVGVGLGVYALAPRSGADRIRVRTRAPEPAFEASAPAARVETNVSALPASVEPVVTAPAPAASSGTLTSAPIVSSLASEEAPAESVGSARFGANGVPNGRVFVLRMSGPVKVLEGDAREDGFSVRVPGRLALDRASPIATSHRAVARALILNRGEYSELTVEFLPGMRPKYQVVGKDNTLEVTLERL